MTTSLLQNRINILHIIILILICVIFRLPTFFLSHNNNDELIHLSLAMKIDKYDLNVFRNKQYNLFFVEKIFIPKRHLVGAIEGEREIGTLFEGFLGEREILSHHPPALPLFIAISHKIFANKLLYIVNISSNVHLMLKNFTIQFYACIVPFLFSLLLILSTYFLGSMFFSHRIGLLSALFLSLTPTELMTANKIWADDMTAFFVTLSIILYLFSLRDKKPIFSLLSGLSCGISIVTKMSGLYIIIIVLLFHIFENRTKKVNLRNLKEFLFDKYVLYFLAGVFIASAWWIDLYLSKFDIRWTKSYFTVNETWETAKTWNPYFKIASNRPWYSYFVLVPFQFPLYSLSFIFVPSFVFKNRVKSFMSFIKEKDMRFLGFLIIWFLAIIIFLTLKPGKELRYMLIAYPAISILSVYCLNLFYEWIKAKDLGISLNSIKLCFISIILLSLFFSLKIALPRILFRADIIPVPF